ncbi:MAG: hypothetical protein AAFR53_04730 [Pseudomonadota bacterium]
MLAFILAVVAGYGARFLKEPLVGSLEKVLLDKVDIRTEDALALSYALCLVGVTLIVVISGSSVSGFVLAVGGLIGLFGKEIVDAIRKQIG